jgi:alkylhydroperoxidase/carboxymuconolactone decarboxylase family protein YurZ
MWVMRSVVVRPFNRNGPDCRLNVARKEALDVNYTDLLRRLSLHDERVAAAGLSGGDLAPPGLEPGLDPRTLALVRLAALVAVGGAVPSYGAQTDAAVDAGATVDEIVDVLVGVVPVVGLPRVVEAAPKLALALGHDVEDVGILPGG